MGRRCGGGGAAAGGVGAHGQGRADSEEGGAVQVRAGRDGKWSAFASFSALVDGRTGTQPANVGAYCD